MLKKILIVWIIVVGFIESRGQIVSETRQQNSFSLKDAVIYVDDADYALVKKSAELFTPGVKPRPNVTPRSFSM